jgi:iron complex transport system substrate-binding protein
MRRALLLCLLLAVSGGAAVRAQVQVIDDAGDTVTLAAPARRIISVAPHLTELLFSAGAGDRVVGAVEYSDHPEAAKKIPRIGDSAQLDLERIVALKPDLILVWRSGTPAQQVRRLQSLGLPVFAGEARHLADISHTLRRLGRLAGTEATAEAEAERFDRAVAQLRARYAGRRPLRVFYQIWHRPLLTVNGEHLISEALGVCGATNVFASLKPLTPAVSVEAVVETDPDAIVTGSVDPAGPDNLDAWRRLRSLRATQLGNLIVVDPDTLHRQSERIVDGTRELCDRLDGVRARLMARG